jgi:uncharacterized protein YegP (UPF0339 family)
MPVEQGFHRVAEGRRYAMTFVVKKSTNGQFRFNLVASNGQVVATSEQYQRKQSALDTIGSIQKNVGAATIDDQTE